MKKILFSVIAAGMFAFGLTSCNPVDSDDHSLGGAPVNSSALAISANVTADETGQNNVVVVTNGSQAQSGVRYYISLDGKTLIETAALTLSQRTGRIPKPAMSPRDGWASRQVLTCWQTGSQIITIGSHPLTGQVA